jgi:hypothetical protein
MRGLFLPECELKFKKKLVNCYIWSIAWYGAETWTLQKLDQKTQANFEIW